ncbi:MAG: oligoribonuclease [Gammaproteobacteria bacterium]
MVYSPDNLVWIDLEMTGLDPVRDTILEIATIVTDANLDHALEGPVIAIHQPEVVLAMMDEWNSKQHGGSGLTARVRASQFDLAEAEAETLTFLKRYIPPKTSPMCGNSICQDRRFLFRYMPSLAEFFHYRNLDVSTLKELQRRWAPQLPSFDKHSSHLALDDIRDSIDELKHYRTHFLRLPV